MSQHEQLPEQSSIEERELVLTPEAYVDALVGAVGKEQPHRLLDEVKDVPHLKVGEKLEAIDFLSQHVSLEDVKSTKRDIIEQAAKKERISRSFGRMSRTKPSLISRRYAPIYQPPPYIPPQPPPRHGR